MNKQDYTIKCFSCANRSSRGFCNITTFIYTPIQAQDTYEIKQQNLIIPCPISNNIEVSKND